MWGSDQVVNDAIDVKVERKASVIVLDDIEFDGPRIGNRVANPSDELSYRDSRNPESIKNIVQKHVSSTVQSISEEILLALKEEPKIFLIFQPVGVT